ncbi:Transcription factor bHLH149 [Platanthera zijinensis]|uniref:Transcription factor bHLH149 n=1 Tax=Platanthera zijinensis TaxID=2320716 RepID=A0AAP0AUT5_9ASPA
MISSPCSTSAAGRKKQRTYFRSPPESKWRSGSQQLIYGRRLFDALRAARSGGGRSAISSRDIKNAADSALALTAQAQTRWSRALLFGCCSRRKVLLKAAGKIRRRRPPRPARKFGGNASPEPTPMLKGKKVTDRLCVLSRIVPGCQKLSAPCLLEEAADYVAALELQVKTMRALADALCASSLSSPSRESAPSTAGACDEFAS